MVVTGSDEVVTTETDHAAHDFTLNRVLVRPDFQVMPQHKLSIEIAEKNDVLNVIIVKTFVLLFDEDLVVVVITPVTCVAGLAGARRSP